MTTATPTRGGTSSTSTVDRPPSHGGLAHRWMEQHLIHGEGDLYGRPYRLLPWQIEFLWRWYEYEGPAHAPRWIHQEALIGKVRGEAKTEFLAALALLEFAGPEPIRPRTPIVQVAAAALKQAGEIFRQAQIMAGGQGQSISEAPLHGLFDVWDTEILRADGSPGRIERVAAEAGTIEGGKATLVLGDELHEWTGRKARVWTVLTASTAKRKMSGRSVAISTAGAGRGSTPAKETDSLLWQIYDRGRRGNDQSFLFMWAELPEAVDIDDPKQLRAGLLALSPGVADVVWSVEDRARMLETGRLPRHEWLRYYANRFVDVGASGWLADHPGAWARCESDLVGSGPVVAGVDMALRGDGAAVATVQRAGERKVWGGRIWHPDGSGKIDFVEIADHLRRLHREHDDFRVAYDPRFFELMAQTLEEEGLTLIEFPQSPDRMVPACEQAWREIVDQTVTHHGDLEFAEHVNAAVWREGDRGRTLTKRKTGGKKIDWLIAAVMANREIDMAGETEPEVLDEPVFFAG